MTVLPTYSLIRPTMKSAQAPQLDADQRAVVDHLGGPMLVLAGPGTGKTTTLVEAMAARLTGDSPVPADRILALTFGRDAAGELRDRVMSRVGGGAVPTVSTFHSFCYALVRAYGSEEFDAEDAALQDDVRLLSGPEQDYRVRELLTGEGASVAWPESLQGALHTRGFAGEVRAVIARARDLGFEPDQLEDLGRRAEVHEWTAVGQFFEEYLQVLDMEGVIDYSELIYRASILLARESIGDRIRSLYDVIYVDEYQDTDPAQVRLLTLLMRVGTTLVAVGDPDQSIYAFRGADVTGIAGFAKEFQRFSIDASGREIEVPIVVLGATRRFGTSIRAAATRVLGGSAYPGLDLRYVERLRHPVCERTDPGRVTVLRTDDELARAAHVADVIRRARLESLETDNPLEWSDICVLVRTGVTQLPVVRRALMAAGVPVDVSYGDVALSHEPAVKPLLAVLHAASGYRPLGADDAVDLLLSELGGAEPSGVRALGRVLRRHRPGQSSAELIRQALGDPLLRDEIEDEALTACRPTFECLERLASALELAQRQMRSGGTVEDVLWSVWAGASSSESGRESWADRLQRTALLGGPDSRAAHRDLDAVCALFELARRASEASKGHVGISVFVASLEGQEIGTSTLAAEPVRGPAVSLMTAHRAKGLEWRMVVIVGADEGIWPDVRLRGSLLQADRLTQDGVGEPPRISEILAEEQRLFYVACTRARDHLVIASLGADEDNVDGLMPSRFIDDVAAGDDVEIIVEHGRPLRPLSIPGLVASLRSVASDPNADASLREAAVERLALLAAADSVTGQSLVPAAHPDRWWGLADWTANAVPVQPADRPVRLSGSALSTIGECPLNYFMSREARGDVMRGNSMSFGSVIHAIAAKLGDGEIEADLDTLDAYVDLVWDQIPFETPWERDEQRAEARAALARLLDYHRTSINDGREVVGTEMKFSVTIPVPRTDGQAVDVALTGSMDRVERDADGQVHVLDFKTSAASNLPTAAEVAEHIQLGVYQAVVQAGGVPEAGTTSGGAALVQLRKELKRNPGLPVVQQQGPLQPGPDGTTWVDDSIVRAVDIIREEKFWATPVEKHCGRCAFRDSCPVHIDEVI